METIVREKEKIPAVPYIPPGNGSGNGGGGWGGGISHSRSNYSIPIQPAKFGLWLFIAASMMLFAAFTSAYIVRSGASDWLRFGIPTVMWIGTIALIFSSISIHAALKSIKAGNIPSFKTSIVLTLFLAVVFVGGQVLGWQSLRQTGLYLDTNASSAFFYMITVTHLVHVIGGMAALLFVTTKGLLGRYSRNNRLGVELCVTYWHFLGALWVYLALFITFT
jgi:cytochrome c oxidase subunit III